MVVLWGWVFLMSEVPLYGKQQVGHLLHLQQQQPGHLKAADTGYSMRHNA